MALRRLGSEKQSGSGNRDRDGTSVKPELEGRLLEGNFTEKPYRWTVDSSINSTITIALVSNGVTRKDNIVGTYVAEINDLQVFASTPPPAPTSGASGSAMNSAGIVVAAAGVVGIYAACKRRLASYKEGAVTKLSRADIFTSLAESYQAGWMYRISTGRTMQQIVAPYGGILGSRGKAVQ
ncbi:hypothetical protein QFC20_005753 [Naganishia adeliensis]|uniref:Uncharacterized protein n=1 Tax=Naganishia adeliensis TaxID=92952 RepID=A0ACC2VJ94_9TREE|nr:hypothetical protein QFC20_005753 [Naganishia adeliensis]